VKYHKGQGSNFLTKQLEHQPLMAVDVQPCLGFSPFTINLSNYGSVKKIKACNLNPGVLEITPGI
jgi:hypothetical protein